MIRSANRFCQLTSEIETGLLARYMMIGKSRIFAYIFSIKRTVHTIEAINESVQNILETKVATFSLKLEIKLLFNLMSTR